MVTNQQVKNYRAYRQSGKCENEAAARSGMTAKTARKWETGALPSQVKKPHNWRTRLDPFEKVWKKHILPLLKADSDGRLQATTIVEYLQLNCPSDGPWDSHLRTLQRHLRVWRATEGPPKEVMFPQEHQPGEEGAYDFTHAEKLNVTIGGAPFPHMFFQYVMSFSGKRIVKLAFGETYEALQSGLQDAFWDCGGVPKRVRHDNLSAATHDLKGLDPKRKLTERYAALLSHYGVESSRIEPGKSNQNGVAEKAHDVLKTRLDQLLRIRGSRDFESIDTYLEFVVDGTSRMNDRCAVLWDQERKMLRPLPSGRIPNYTEFKRKVAKWSCVRIGENTYSVPSRLIGEEVTLRVYPDKIEVLYHAKCMDAFRRLHGKSQHRIDYRHIIGSLVRKPGAFLNYRFREELFPSVVFRKAYDALQHRRGERAYVDYVRILHLAAMHSESDVELALEMLLEAAKPFDSAEVESLVAPRKSPSGTALEAFKPVLIDFNKLLSGECHAHFKNANLAFAS